MAADISTSPLPTYHQDRHDPTCPSGDYNPASKHRHESPSPPGSADLQHVDDATTASNRSSIERPASRHSLYASLSTPASATSSIFPSNSTTSTSTTVKSSGMSSPASASEKSFTPATSAASSVATTSPSSAALRLGRSQETEQLTSKADVHEPLSLTPIQPGDSDSIWWRRQKTAQSDDKAAAATEARPRSWAMPSSLWQLGAGDTHVDAPSRSPPKSFALHDWGPASGLMLPGPMLSKHDAASVWSTQPTKDHGLSGASRSASSTAASSPQQPWFPSSVHVGSDKGNGSLGLSIHDHATGFHQSPLAVPAQNKAPFSLPSTTGGHTSTIGGLSQKNQLDSIKLALQQLDAQSMPAAADPRAAFAAVPTTTWSAARGIRADELAHRQHVNGLGRGVGNGVHSDGVWSASVSPSMTILPLPVTSSASCISHTIEHRQDHLRNAAGSLTPFSTVSSNASTTTATLAADNLSQPRSAASAPSSALPSTPAETGGPTFGPAEIDQALASIRSMGKTTPATSNLLGATMSMSGDQHSGLWTGFSSPLAPSSPEHRHRSQNGVNTGVPPSGLPFSHTSQPAHSIEAGGSSGLATALGLTTASGTLPRLPASTAVSTGFSNAALGHSAEARTTTTAVAASGAPLKSGTYSAFGSPSTLSMTLMHHEGSQPLGAPLNGGGPSPNNRKLNLYKTELCRNWEEKGTCRYGVKCQYAHGDAELRPVERHAKYKTEICRTFWRTGSCPYAKRCCFIHTTAADAGGHDSGSVGHGQAPLIARVSGDRHGHGSASVHSSMPGSPVVSMNRNLTGGSAGPFNDASKPDPLALSSLNDALAGLNLGMTSTSLSNDSSRYRHQPSSSVGSSAQAHQHAAQAPYGQGHGHGQVHNLLGHSALGSGPRFFKGPAH